MPSGRGSSADQFVPLPGNHMDIFLNTLQWDNQAIFDLSNGHSTISIRDQMVRAVMLGDRLPVWLKTEYNSDEISWPILVIGAGACGMSAAIALASQGLQVLVVDRIPVPFSVQLDCTTRWLDPTQYDWPMDHWTSQSFRWQNTHSNPPFPWNADHASLIVKNQWIPLLNTHTRAIGKRLKFRGRTDARIGKISIRKTMPKLLFPEIEDLETGQRTSSYGFAAIIIATGSAPERCSLPNCPKFVGYPFWSTDPFEKLSSGVAGDKSDRVLVSGAGDGALQDFLRVLTRRKSVRQIFDDLKLGAAQFDINRIFSAEQKAERALNWCQTRKDSFAVGYLKELHQTHSEVVGSLIRKPEIKRAIVKITQDRPEQTYLVTTTNTFSCNYPLNRFLSLLLIESFNDNSVQWLQSRRVKEIQPRQSWASASPTAQDCLGCDWKVTLLNETTQAEETIDANVIILRHGVANQPNANNAGRYQTDGPRPIPPTHLY